MDLEHLNKAQIILLTLLVSFMTSIATGVTTVFLLDQAPEPVTRTINSVVEKTIQTVVPEDIAKLVAKETTVVVKEEGLIASAIDANAGSVARIYTVSEGDMGSSTDKSAVFRGLGIIVSSDGVIAVPDSLAVKGRSYSIVIGNTELSATILTEGRGDIALLQATTSSTTPSLRPASLGTTRDLKLGQSVIALAGEKQTSVTVGIVSAIIPGDESLPPRVDAALPGTTVVGSPLLTLSGSVVGLYLGDLKVYAPLTSDIVSTLKAPAPKKSSESAASTSPAAAASSLGQ